MQIFFVILSVLVGMAVGILQVWLLSHLLRALTAKNYASAVIPLMMKTVLYAGLFTVYALLFTNYIIPLGAGVGGGIVAAAVVSTVVGIIKNK